MDFSQIVKKDAKTDFLYQQALASSPSKSDQRRALILQAVVRLLATDGVDSLTFETVGKAAKMARSHVVYYFTSRDELVAAAIRFAAFSAAHIIDSHVVKDEPWKLAIRHYVEGNFDWIQRFPQHANVYTLLYYQACLHPQYRALNTEIRDAGTARISTILERGPARSKKAIRVLAKAIQGLVTGNLIDVMTTNAKNLFEERRKETLDVIEVWLSASP